MDCYSLAVCLKSRATDWNTIHQGPLYFLLAAGYSPTAFWHPRKETILPRSNTSPSIHRVGRGERASVEQGTGGGVVPALRNLVKSAIKAYLGLIDEAKADLERLGAAESAPTPS